MPPIHEQIVERSFPRDTRRVRKAGRQKRPEFGIAHLARGAGEFRVANPSPALHMARHLHVVGSVGDDGIRPFSRPEAIHVGLRPGVAAQNPMTAEQPNFAEMADRGTRRGWSDNLGLRPVLADFLQNYVILRR